MVLQTAPRWLARWEAPALLLLRIVLPLVGFWAFTALVGLADYENGLERAVSLLAATIGLCLLAPRALPSRRIVLVTLAIAALCLTGYRAHQAQSAVEAGRSPTIDIGTTTIAAVEATAAGRSPYVERMDFFGDQARPGGTGWDHFAGFKYGPVMTAVYAPGVLSAGAGGYFVTSLLSLVALAAVSGWWAVRSAGRTAGAGAAALVLSTAFIDGELFHAGVNDVVPMALLVGAFAARARGNGLVAGVLLGLSFGAKTFPAALLALPLLLGARTRRLELAVTATAVGFFAYLPALLQAPREVVSNLLLFNLSRPGDRTGLLDGLPEGLRPAARLLTVALIVLVLYVLALVVREDAGLRPRQAAVASVAALALALSFAGSPVLHRNWLFWIVPLIAVSVAVKAWGADRPSEDRVAADEERGEQPHQRGGGADDQVVRTPALGEAGQRPEHREDDQVDPRQ